MPESHFSKIRFSIRSLLLAITTLAIACFCWHLFGLYVMWRAFGAGEVRDTTDWPLMLHEACDAYGPEQLGDIRVFERRGLTDCQYLWTAQFPDTKSAVDFLSEYEMTSVTPDEGVIGAFHSDPKPTWWCLDEGDSTEYYSSPAFTATKRGWDGEHYFCLLNLETSQVWVWHKSNF